MLTIKELTMLIGAMEAEDMEYGSEPTPERADLIALLRGWREKLRAEIER